MNRLLGYCQSPIEEKFAVALAESFGVDGDQISFRGACDLGVLMKDYTVDKQVFPVVACAPQVHAGNYIVDFMFVAQRPGSGRPILVAVECDGHEFHVKNKQQVARDRARDRTFASCGIYMMRFTGYELYRDARACAVEAYDAIFDMYCNALDDMWEAELGALK